MARRVRFFSTQIQKEKDVVPIRPLYDSAPLVTVGPRAAQTIDELDVTLAEHESRLVKMNDSYQTLSERTRELVEARHVLRETAVFFEKVRTMMYFLCHSLANVWASVIRRKVIRLTSDRLLMILPLPYFNSTIARTSFLPRTFNLISSE